MRSTEYKRSDRLGEVIKEEISLLLLREVKDPRIGFVSITKVKLSGDLRCAKVYFSIYGTEKEKDETLEGLDNAKGFIKKVLGKKLKLRRIPDLIFCFDDTLEYGNHIESIIKRLKRDEGFKVH